MKAKDFKNPRLLEERKEQAEKDKPTLLQEMLPNLAIAAGLTGMALTLGMIHVPGLPKEPIL